MTYLVKHMAKTKPTAIDIPQAQAEESSVPATIIGRVSRFEAGKAFVNFGRNPTDAPLLAQSTVGVSTADVGAEVALVFIDGDLCSPVITGFLQNPEDLESSDFKVEVDGEEVAIRGNKRVVLQCGKASITLTEDGKVLIRGTYFLAQSSGIAQLKGGILRLN